MKHHVTQHSRRTSETSPYSEAPGPQASAFAPPAYGIDFADRGMPAPAPVQSFGQLEEERGIQESFATSVAAPVTARPAPAPNRTGLPDRLKVGIESLSGLDLSDVRVHSNSDKPAQLNALACTQGSDIHVAPGQEQHLSHEAWHVVQQAQGRVKPTMQMKDGVPVNDDEGLEREAAVMGARAAVAAQPAVVALLSEGQGERAEEHPQRRRISAQGEKGPLNFLSSVKRISHFAGDDSDRVNASSRPLAGREMPVQGKFVGDLEGKRISEVIEILSSKPNLNPEIRRFIETENQSRVENFFKYLNGIPDALDSNEILGRSWHVILSLPMFKSSVEARVKQALSEVPTESLSKETIIQSLEKHFKDYSQGLHAATRDPSFSSTLLEEIRQRQSKSWIKATEIKKVEPKAWQNKELQHWNLRHYSNKCMVTLGEDLGEGIFRVATVDGPPFTDILSTVTLATIPGSGGSSQDPNKRSGEKVMMVFTAGSAKSGHTTGIDWANIGNVGDTFYGLFYKDEPATGITPAFIKDAVYYAIWPATEFGGGWASADWLGTAAESREEGGKTPEGIPREGQLSDVIADIFPEAATRDFRGTQEKETSESKSRRAEAFSAMGNFEIKKHGSTKVKEWIAIPSNVDKIKDWFVDTKGGKFIKLKPLLPESVKKKLEATKPDAISMASL